MGALETLKSDGRRAAPHLAILLMSIAALTGCGGGSNDQTEPNSGSAAQGQRQQAMSAGTTATATPAWAKVADEGVLAFVSSQKNVRYGVAGKGWVTKSIKGSFRCDVATFGSDPAVGVAKSCEVYDGNKSGMIKLAWSASPDSTVAGYRVYYGTASKTYLQAMGAGIPADKQLAFTLAGLRAGNTFYFAVTSVDAAGNESAFSNEASEFLE